VTAFIDSADVATYLGRDLSDAEAAQVDAVIDAACEYVENYCGRSFAVTAVTDEPVKIVGNTIYLGRAITAVASVKTRSPYVGFQTTTLGASEWSIWDYASGKILVSGFMDSDALVSYTPATTVPAEVTLAATILAAGMLAFTGDSNRSSTDIKSYSVGQELQVTYFDTSTSGNVPAQVTTLLGPYKRPVFA
jgi:hypothetical protein